MLLQGIRCGIEKKHKQQIEMILTSLEREKIAIILAKCTPCKKGQSPHQVKAHSLGSFALSSHWHWQFLSVAEESQSGPLVRDMESLKFKSSF